MFFINNNSLNPYYNLALEEQLFLDKDNEYFILYRNTPSVIIGKHQNPYKECSFSYLLKNKIDIVRRMSGGGTVYHDEGNINFSMILNSTYGKQIDFRRYTKPIIDYIKLLGLQPEFSERNDILITGLKISGNAEHVVKNRVLHHGTLLFNTDLKILKASLNTNKLLIETKAVNSVKSKVTNISNHLERNLTIEKFISGLAGYIKEKLETQDFNFTEELLKKISVLTDSKYKTWDWNYGYSPDFSINLRGILKLKITKGYISSINALTDNIPQHYDKLKNTLLYKKYEYCEMQATLQNLNEPDIDIEIILNELF